MTVFINRINKYYIHNGSLYGSIKQYYVKAIIE